MPPGFIRCDNGTELKRQRPARLVPLHWPPGTAYIEPASPWQNAWVKSYGGRMRDELLAIEQSETSHVAVTGLADGGPQRVSEFVTVLPATWWAPENGTSAVPGIAPSTRTTGADRTGALRLPTHAGYWVPTSVRTRFVLSVDRSGYETGRRPARPQTGSGSKAYRSATGTSLEEGSRRPM